MRRRLYIPSNRQTSACSSRRRAAVSPAFGKHGHKISQICGNTMIQEGVENSGTRDRLHATRRE
jgi:hypothetical protein